MYIAIVGQYGMTPEQLQEAGIIKPGTAPLVNSLINRGVSLANAMPQNIFTGKQGATNIAMFGSSATAQGTAMNNLFQKAEKNLQNARVITGKENSSQTAGVIKAAATVGVGNTINAIKVAAGNFRRSGRSRNYTGATKGKAVAANPAFGLAAAGGSLAGAANSAIASAQDKVMNAIGSGNLAGKFADSATSALGGLKNSLEGLSKAQGLSGIKDQAKGMAAAAFSAIKDSFPKLPAGVPVNVADEAKKAAEKAAEAATAQAGAALGKLSSATGAGSALADKAKGALAGVQNNLTGGAAALGKSVTSAAGSAASGLSSAVAGASTAATGKLTSAVSSATGALGQTTSALTSAAAKVSPAGGNAGSLVGAVTGKATGALSAASGSLSSAVQGGASTLASGLSNLPGGAGAAGALVNKGKSALSGALGKVGSSLKGAATAAIGNLKPPALDAAAALAKSGLPAGLAAQLETQIASLGAGGGAPVKMATVALNTTNRDSITSQITATLGDPGIPAPNQLGEIPEAATTSLEDAKKAFEAASEASTKAFDEFQKVEKERLALFAELDTAKATLPQGDPAIAALEAKKAAFKPVWLAAKEKAVKANDAAIEAGKKYNP